MQKTLVDTNLILRFLLDGDTLLPELAKKSIVWLPNEVIFETVHVLVRIYKLERADVFELVMDLLMKPNIDSDRILMFNTLACFKDNKSLSFIDCFLTNLSEREKVELVTYDEKLKKRLVRKV